MNIANFKKVIVRAFLLIKSYWNYTLSTFMKNFDTWFGPKNSIFLILLLLFFHNRFPVPQVLPITNMIILPIIYFWIVTMIVMPIKIKFSDWFPWRPNPKNEIKINKIQIILTLKWTKLQKKPEKKKNIEISKKMPQVKKKKLLKLWPLF